MFSKRNDKHFVPHFSQGKISISILKKKMSRFDTRYRSTKTFGYFLQFISVERLKKGRYLRVQRELSIPTLLFNRTSNRGYLIWTLSGRPSVRNQYREQLAIGQVRGKANPRICPSGFGCRCASIAPSATRRLSPGQWRGT